MDTLKRSLSALLVLVMVLGMLPMSALATEEAVQETAPAETISVTEETVVEETVSETIAITAEEEAELVMAEDVPTSGTCGENLTWKFDEATGTMTISGTGDMESYAAKSRPWEHITDKLTKLVVCGGVNSVGVGAFMHCANLREASLGITIESLGAGSFSGTGLTTVTIPSFMKTIGDNTFENCANLAMVIFTGDAPEFGTAVFLNDSVTISYPAYSSWTADKCLDYGGTITWQAINLSEQYIQNLIYRDSNSVVVDGSVVLENDFEIPVSVSQLNIEGSIIVPNGKTLTISSAFCNINGSIQVEDGGVLYVRNILSVCENGRLRINKGAKLTHSDLISVDGILDLDGILEPLGDFARVIVNKDGNVHGMVNGIAQKNVEFNYIIRNNEDMQNAFQVMESQAYKRMMLVIPYDNYEFILSRDVNIPEKCDLQISANVTIAEGVTVTNNGDIRCTIHAKAAVINNGTIVNNKKIYVSRGKLVNNGTIQNNRFLEISSYYNTNGVLHNHGVIENTHELHLSDGLIWNNGSVINIGEGRIVDGYGTWTGNDPMQRAYEETEPADPAHKSEQYIQNQIDSGETQIYIDEEIVLENDFTLPGNVMLMIRNGGSVTVPAGKTLTSDGGRINIWAGGSVIVEAGGTLNNWGYMDVSGTLENHGTFEGQVHTYYNFSDPTFVGINDQQIWMHYVVEGDDPDANQAKFLEHWALMESTNYGRYSQQIHGSMTLPGDLIIPANCYLVLESMELTFTIPEDAKVINKGSFSSYENQTVVNNGTFENSGNLNIYGPWLGNPITAAKMTQDDLEAAIAENAEKGWSYHLTNEVTLERDLIMENGQLFIGQGGKLIVPAGKKLQIHLMVHPGGVLECYGECPEVGVEYDNGTLGTVIGIPENEVNMYYYVYSQEEFNNDIQVALDTNFARDFLYIWENVTLSKDTTIDEKTVVHMYGGKTLTVPADKTLTIKGGLCIWEGQTLVNNGTIDNYGFLDNWSTVINNGTVNDSGYITNNGTWEGNQPVRAKMTQDDLEAALANAAATGSYYALKDEVVLERDLTVNTFFDISSGGHLVVPENVTLTLNQSISVMPGGVLEVVGDYKLNDGIINVYNFGNGNIGTVHGVEMAHMCLNADANSESELLSALETAANTNYNFDCIYVMSSFELTKNAVIPQHCVIHMYNGATLTVQKGAALTNKGDIYLWNGQTLQNDGTIENDGRIHVVGQLTNKGTININENGFMGVDPNGAVQNNGTVKVDGLLDGPGTADGKPTYKWEGNPPVYPHTHAYTETVTTPTCTEKGYTTYICECGDSYVDNYVDATGHSFGDWYVTKEATTEAEGQERRDCAACDHFETRAIPKVEISTEGQCGEGLTWSYDKATGTLTITGSGAMWNFTISLKQKSADPMVPWAAYQSEIKAVVLSEGITSIGNNAFAGCENLTEVTLPKTVTAIGEGAFLDSGLKEITFQGDAPEVSESAFQGVRATITYPQDNETWTEDKKQDFGGDLEWNEPEDDHGYQLGDVNHDTKINAKDATLILQKSVGVLKDSAKFCEDCAEVSGDGKLNAKDSTLILQYSVGLRTDFPRQK